MVWKSAILYYPRILMSASSTPSVYCVTSVTSGFQSVQKIICKLCKSGCNTARFVRSTWMNRLHLRTNWSLPRVPGPSFRLLHYLRLGLSIAPDLTSMIHPPAPLVPVSSTLSTWEARDLFHNQTSLLPYTSLVASQVPLPPRSRTSRQLASLQFTSLAGETLNNERLLSGQMRLSERLNRIEYSVLSARSGCNSGKTVLTVHTHGCSIVENV